MSGLDDFFIQRLAEDMAGEIAGIVERAMLAGVVLGSGSGAVWDLVNDQAVAFARHYTYELAGLLSESTVQMVQRSISRWIETGEPVSSLIRDLEQSGIFAEDRARTIAETEVTRVFAAGNLMAWANDPTVTAKSWYTAQDERVCPVCHALAGRTMALGDLFPASAIGGLALDDVPGPPAHPRCRCWLVPDTDVTVTAPQAGDPGYDVFQAAGIAAEDVA